MGLVLKYVVRTPAGAFQYRRRVPKEVAEVIGKREFKKLLGDTERVALAAWPKFHAEVERDIATAARVSARGQDKSSVTDREAYLEAQKRVAEMRSYGTPDEVLYEHADNMFERYRRDPETGTPLDVPLLDTHTINLLRNGEQHRAPEPTLEDAKRLYIAEKNEEAGGEADVRSAGRVERVVDIVSEVLGRNPVVSSLTRDDARRVRDHMLSRIKSNGEKISSTSVSRELNDIKAVVSYAKREMGLPDTFQNPFRSL